MDNNNIPEDMLTLGNRFITFSLILLLISIFFLNVDEWFKILK